MQYANKIAWLLLHRLSDVSNSQRLKLAEEFTDITAIFSAAEARLKQCGLSDAAILAIQASFPLTHQNEKQYQALKVDADLPSAVYLQVVADIKALDSIGSSLVSIQCEAYPQRLKEISSPPALLYVRGDASLLSRNQLAMVGSRRATKLGGETAFQFARALAQNGLVITSGLALGIDTAAHQGSLAAKGLTIGVMATGIDQCYPRRNSALYQAVLSNGGLLVTEFPLGAQPRRNHFPQRNRIISGLSLGVLVVEATLQSGSLITARFALDQNREVFAIPGSIHSPGSKGCNGLIRDGAKLVETVEDVVEELSGGAILSKEVEQPRASFDLSAKERALLDVLPHSPVVFDWVLATADLPVGELMALLVNLEIKGLISQEAGCYTKAVESF